MLLDAIEDLATGDYTVTRRGEGTVVDGFYVPNPTTTTVTVTGSIQPARGLPRVTGGRDMITDEQNQHTVEALVGYFTSQLYERTDTRDPDLISINGRTYTVVRSEEWTLDDETYWVAVMTLQTGGKA